ncbi:hypothetical protein ABIA39_001040 [Nocardia sp. GAS34]
MSAVFGRGDKDMTVTLESAAAKWFGLFDEEGVR